MTTEKVKMTPMDVCDRVGIRVVHQTLSDGSVVFDVKMGDGEWFVNCTSQENAHNLLRDIAAAIQKWGME